MFPFRSRVSPWWPSWRCILDLETATTLGATRAPRRSQSMQHLFELPLEQLELGALMLNGGELPADQST